MEQNNNTIASLYNSLKQNFLYSFAPTKKSLHYLWLHKKLLLFPLFTLSLICACTVGLDMVVHKIYGHHAFPFLNKPSDTSFEKKRVGRRRGIPLDIIYFLLITYICSRVSNIAFSRSLTSVFSGGAPKILNNLLYALIRSPYILWSCLFTLLVGIFREEWFTKKYNLPRQIHWTMNTFLVIPIMAHEDHGTTKNISRSSELIQNSFGHTVIEQPPVFAMYGFLIVFIAIITVFLVVISLFIPLLLDLRIYTIVGIIILVITFICFISSANTVLKTSTYNFTLGKPTGPFDEKEIKKYLMEPVKI